MDLAFVGQSALFGFRAFCHEWVRNMFGAIVLAVGAFTVTTFLAYLDRVYWGIAETTIRSQTGHIQITVRGYESQKVVAGMHLMLEDWTALAERIGSMGFEYEFITPRLEFSGLIGNGGEKTAVFVGVGVDPAVDHRVSSFETVKNGSPLNAGDGERPVIVAGDVLLGALGLGIGDGALMLGVGPDGGLNALDVQVKGLMLSDSPAYNQRYVKLPLGQAQTLMHTDAVSKLVILLEDSDRTEEVAAAIRANLEASGLQVEVNTWRDLNPSFDKVKAIYTRMFRFLGAAVGILVIVTLANLTIINFIERRNQVVILLVKGYSRMRVALIFAFENMLTGIAGCTLGLLSFQMVFGIVNAMGGIWISPPPGSVNGVIYKLTMPWSSVPTMYLVLLCISTLASLICLCIVHRMNPADYMRRV